MGRGFIYYRFVAYETLGDAFAAGAVFYVATAETADKIIDEMKEDGVIKQYRFLRLEDVD